MASPRSRAFFLPSIFHKLRAITRGRLRLAGATTLLEQRKKHLPRPTRTQGEAPTEASRRSRRDSKQPRRCLKSSKALTSEWWNQTRHQRLAHMPPWDLACSPSPSAVKYRSRSMTISRATLYSGCRCTGGASPCSRRILIFLSGFASVAAMIDCNIPNIHSSRHPSITSRPCCDLVETYFVYLLHLRPNVLRIRRELLLFSDKHYFSK